MFDWLFGSGRRDRRRTQRAAPFPAAWQRVLDGLPFYGRLDAAGQQRLRQDLRLLVVEKEWEGCGGLELTDEIRVTIAAQASLLLLGLEHDHFPSVQTILVYPSAYVTMPTRDRAGVVVEGQNNLGEAWRGGPVVLAWDAARGGARDPDDGRNLVLHEFAHKLDMQDGLADGTPRLPDRAALRRWVAVMTRELEQLRGAAEAGRATLLDHYGATNPAEFFAVATECFFERSEELRERHPELYGRLRSFYGQDPARPADGGRITTEG